MARKARQKLKLLYLMDLLLRRSDEDHPVTIAQILEHLDNCGIPAERKSIYDDLDALREFGLDILQSSGRSGGYYVASRDFELPELKLLVDSVQSSKFITEKKTLSLIRKIENLTSVHQAQLLQRQVFVRDRVKSMNESVYYVVDALSAAIHADEPIRFRYYEYAPDKSRRYRREGAYYEGSPYALLWDNENYYLLAYDHASAQIRHYRVDKMTDITPLPSPRQGKEVFSEVTISTYTKGVFGMFAGQEQPLRLRFAAHLAGAVIDRFGKDVMLVPDGEHFTITVPVVVSPQFFGWLFGFGADGEILSPPDVRRRMADYTAAVAALYAP